MALSGALVLRNAAVWSLDRFQALASGATAVAESFLSGIYGRSDRRPWRLGYTQFRAKYLKRALSDPKLLEAFRLNQPLPAGHGYRLDARVVELPWALSRLGAMSPGRVLDAGSSLNFEPVLRAPAMKDHSTVILTLAPERRCYWHMGISYLFADLRKLYLADESFDALTCISTIEHVGMDNAQYAGDQQNAAAGRNDEFLSAVIELRRVLKTGSKLYISFPFGRYENHGWFQQFDSELTDRLIEAFRPASVEENVYRYTSEGWSRSTRADCRDCEFFDVRESKYFKSGSTLDFPPHCPAGESAVMCLALQK